MIAGDGDAGIAVAGRGGGQAGLSCVTGCRVVLSSFEPGHVPRDPAVGECGPQSVPLEHGEHRRRRVGEGAELSAEQAEAEVLGGHDRARDRVPWWVAEDEHASGVVGCPAEQPLVVRVAADDAVQHDDVGRLDVCGVDGDVVEPALDAAFDAGLSASRPACCS
jgi:hypothetical protein